MQVEEAATQIDFLNEISMTDKSSELIYLAALAAWKKDHDREAYRT